MPPTWEALVRALVTADAYPEARGREEAFVAERLAMVSTEGTAHELRLDDRHLLASDQRLPDGSVVHLKLDITDHRRAELALAEQETRLRALVRALPDLWLVIDAEGRYLESADERHPLLARPFTEIRGRRVDELLPADIAARCMDAIRQAIASGEVQRIEYPLRTSRRQRAQLRGTHRADGRRPHPLPAARHDRGAAAGPRRAADAARDGGRERAVDEHRRRDAARPAAGLRQHRLRAPHRLSARRGSGPQLPLPAAWRGRASGARHAACGAGRGRACTVLLRNRRRDGSLFINELHVAPIRDANGRLTHFIGVQSDVTERSQAAERLAYSEALYRSVAGAISDGLLVVDPEGHIVTLNPAACTLIGRSAAELSGRALAELGFELRRDDGRPLGTDDHPVREALRDGRRVERTYFVLRPDGVRLLLQTSLQPLRFGAEDAPPYFVITLRDISAQRTAEAALAQAEARWKLALDGAGDGVWGLRRGHRRGVSSPRPGSACSATRSTRSGRGSRNGSRASIRTIASASSAR
jgi:PAS domain S-box-containing protein